MPQPVLRDLSWQRHKATGSRGAVNLGEEVRHIRYVEGRFRSVA
jgi:hypothetical protein